MTTVIVDRIKGEVLSDSRGTQTVTSTEISWFKRKVKTENIIHDDTQKIFRLGKTVITGSGSLVLLEEIVDRFKLYQYHTPKSFWINCDMGLSNTTVLVNKKFQGKVKTVKLSLKPKRFFGNWIKVTVDKTFPDTAYTVTGSGHQYATGALEVGSDPYTALEAAKKYDIYSGGETQKEVL